MRINNKNSSVKNRNTIVILAIIALMVIGVTAYAFISKIGPFAPSDQNESGINYNPPSEDEKKAGEDIKNNVDSGLGNPPVGSDPSPPPDPIPSRTKSKVGMDITAANQSGDTLVLRTIIQAVTSSGTCTLTMIGPNNKTFRQEVGVQALASSSTCQGFNVPLSSISTGQWKVQIGFSNDTLQASTEKDVTIQ